MITNNLRFREKKNVNPCKPQFYYIKVGCKGVYISQTCLHDVLYFASWVTMKQLLFLEFLNWLFGI